MPLRQVEVRDILADALGASLAAGALYAWSRIANMKRPRAVTVEDLRARARSPEAKPTRGV